MPGEQHIKLLQRTLGVITRDEVRRDLAFAEREEICGEPFDIRLPACSLESSADDSGQ
jgi:hypothetical protein